MTWGADADIKIVKVVGCGCARGESNARETVALASPSGSCRVMTDTMKLQQLMILMSASLNLKRDVSNLKSKMSSRDTGNSLV